MSDPVTRADLVEIVTVTPRTITDILTKRFGQGKPGTSLTMSCHEAHMLMAKLHGNSQVGSEHVERTPVAPEPPMLRDVSPIAQFHRDTWRHGWAEGYRAAIELVGSATKAP